MFPDAHVPERLGTEGLPHSLACCRLPTGDRTHCTTKGSWGLKEGRVGERGGAPPSSPERLASAF